MSKELAIIFPNIQVQLSGENGNALALVSKVSMAMKRNGIDREKIEEFSKEALSDDYDNVLSTCMKWVDVS